MSTRNLIALIVVILVVVGSYFAYHELNKPKRHPYDFAGPCPGKTVTKKMEDVYMRGVIEKDEEYKLIDDYYWCNDVNRGDIILYRFSMQREPVVRRVVG